MKYCNICNKDFSDSLNFCTCCGSKLVEKAEKMNPELKVNNKPGKKVGKIIKRVVIGIVVLITILFVWGSHLINSTTYLTFNSEGKIFAKCGGQAEVNIDYDGYIWEVSYKPSWVIIDEYETSFKIKCNPNITGQDRKDHITIKSGKVVQSLPVGQYACTQYIRLSESDLSSSMDGCSIHIDIDTDGTGAEISYPEFCRIEDKSFNGFTLVIKSNDDYSRFGTLYVREDNVVASIFIRQEGMCPGCNGRGSNTCPSCLGTGSLGWGMYFMTCLTCGGSGSIYCSSCGGDGIK